MATDDLAYDFVAHEVAHAMMDGGVGDNADCIAQDWGAKWKHYKKAGCTAGEVTAALGKLPK